MDSITIRSAKAQHSLMEWRQRVADCRSSGQPVTRWCAEHNINMKTYYNWQKKVFAAMVEQQQLQLEAPQEASQGLQNSNRRLCRTISLLQFALVKSCWMCTAEPVPKW